ncbi:hypothetical protein Y1Q_0017113 [Alligator mississippiensis]|uniref:Uncharacterized protein n=1 Tax=Alligator mississippiensis TaxID=8496 RepID=A0A151M8Q2_ALLMI|nr:hypothetical protein Y1Q_0017113 [Alligator mississippiensis]
MVQLLLSSEAGSQDTWSQFCTQTWSPKWSPTKCLYSAQSNSAPVAAGPPVTKANNIVKKTECFKNLRAECLKRLNG